MSAEHMASCSLETRPAQVGWLARRICTTEKLGRVEGCDGVTCNHSDSVVAGAHHARSLQQPAYRTGATSVDGAYSDCRAIGAAWEYAHASREIVRLHEMRIGQRRHSDEAVQVLHGQACGEQRPIERPLHERGR
eukprot:scaffold80304_cov71-Phaeocystis_antarctica.AAC.5